MNENEELICQFLYLRPANRRRSFSHRVHIAKGGGNQKKSGSYSVTAPL